MLNFFCGLHSLVHFAEAASKTLCELDQGGFDQEPPIHDPRFRKATESGTARLIRTASNALGRGGNAKCGKYGDFKEVVAEFLKESGLRSLPIQPYHGNRFNILFENAVSLFFLHEHIEKFLQDHQSNGLLQSVLHDLKTPEYLAGVKALGLISRLVTSPLWRLLEAKDIHIFRMNKHYKDLVDNLEVAANNVQDFMQGRILIFEEENKVLVKNDVMHQKLLEPWEHDDKVKTALNVLLPAVSVVAKHLFEDHLPKGKWSKVTDEMRRKSRGTHKHNKFSESVFGYLDQIMRKSPSITTLSAEAYLMFLANKTGDWLKSKTQEERDIHIGNARQQAPGALKQFKERRHEIRQQHLQALEEEARLSQEKERRRLEVLEGYTTAIITHGLWQSVDEVDIRLSTYKTKGSKTEALKAQLNFRNHILHQEKKIPDHDNLFSFSKRVDGKTVVCSIEELVQKVNPFDF